MISLFSFALEKKSFYIPGKGRVIIIHVRKARDENNE